MASLLRSEPKNRHEGSNPSLSTIFTYNGVCSSMAELLVVIQMVAGSSPVMHPKFRRLAERFMALVLKPSEGYSSVSSNLTSSARFTYFGRLLEWLISSVLKTVGRVIGTRVQIPYLPPVLYILERCMSGLSGLPFHQI